jgi:hypothetical protein
MRLIWITTWWLSAISILSAQSYFPIKVEKKWGLINSEGQIVLDPVYDAIGEFKEYGYAVMQKQDGVGLLNRRGEEIFPPQFEDIKVLDSTLMAVLDRGEWMVIDLQGRTILSKGYDKVKVWDSTFLVFQQKGRWGVIRKDGVSIVPAAYEEIHYEKDLFFTTEREGQMGLISLTGQPILKNIAEEIQVFNDSMIFFRQNKQWGAITFTGQLLIEPEYQGFNKLNDQFIRLLKGQSWHIFSIPFGRIINRGEFDGYYSFSKRFVLIKKNRKLGLLDWTGEVILSPRYTDIQAFDLYHFRVNYDQNWGIVNVLDSLVVPFQYDYIAPPKENLCVVKKEGMFGVVSLVEGEVVEPVYDRIVLESRRAKAYSGTGKGQDEQLSLYHFDENGRLSANGASQRHLTVKIAGKDPAGNTRLSDPTTYQLERFEWFFSPEKDHWGLRNLEDGSIQIPPTFDFIQVEKELGVTLVGIQSANDIDFERTTFRFKTALGLVNNDLGLLVTDLDFLDIRFEDFYEGRPLARCIFTNGRYGLIDRIGRVIRRDLTYVGAFESGLARASVTGRLSGSLKAEHGLSLLRTYLNQLQSDSYMLDYTQYDQIFRKEAYLICEDCNWGFLDSTGVMVIEPQFTFARDFINEVGIVAAGDKWGVVDRRGQMLIPCQYDGVAFLDNTDNKIIRVYRQEPKYGLIDTLGQLRVNAVYDEIGAFSEGRLAVRRGGLWGFINADGEEVIPCRYREVANFSEGLAAVKLGHYWGYVDQDGEVQVSFKYAQAGDFREGLAWVSDRKGVGYIDRQEQWAIEPQFEKGYEFFRGVARVVIEGRYGLINREGDLILKPKYDQIKAFDLYGLAVYSTGKDEVKYGVLNLRGEAVTKPVFLSIDAFQEGMAAVKLRDGYGYIDTTGRMVIPAVYSLASGFSEGRAAVQFERECGYIAATGDQVVPFQFSKCMDFEGGKAIVYNGIRRAGLVDRNGELVLEPSVTRLLKFQEGRGLVRDEAYRFYFITEQANLYDGYYQKASAFQHGIAVVQVDDKWGVINRQGIEVIPPKYDKIGSFENGYAKVRIKGFNGLINVNGELIAQADYEYISYAGEGVFRVEQGGKVGYFDQQGNWIWSLSE